MRQQAFLRGTLRLGALSDGDSFRCAGLLEKPQFGVSLRLLLGARGHEEQARTKNHRSGRERRAMNSDGIAAIKWEKKHECGERKAAERNAVT